MVIRDLEAKPTSDFMKTTVTQKQSKHLCHGGQRSRNKTDQTSAQRNEDPWLLVVVVAVAVALRSVPVLPPPHV
ncbi:unnamed protein product [Cochlearia groenlandica]